MRRRRAVTRVRAGMVPAAVAALLAALLVSAPAAPATEVLPVGPVAKMVTGPVGMTLLAPAEELACPARGPALKVAVR